MHTTIASDRRGTIKKNAPRVVRNRIPAHTIRKRIIMNV